MNAPLRTHAPRTITLPIRGMTCASCVRRIEKALNALPGVAGAHVNLATERAEVALSDAADRQALVEAVRDAGYVVPAVSIDLAIAGMTCASCVGRVEKAPE